MTVGTRRYVGKLRDAKQYEPVDDEFEHMCPANLELEEAYELMTFTQPVQVGPGQVAIQRKTMLFPYDTCGHPVVVRLRPSEVSWAEDFHANDRAMYRELLANVRAQMEEARAQKLGLTLAGPSTPLPDLKGGSFGRS